MAITLGIAKGRIIIDVDDVANARAKVVRETQVMQESFHKTGKAADDNAKKAGMSFKGLADQLSSFGQSMIGLSLLGGGIAALGLKASGTIEQMNMRFVQLTGNQQKASELMKVIENRARAMGAPVVETQRAFAAILPNLDDGAKRAEKWVGVIQRLVSSSGGMQDASGAAFSINEALTSLQSGNSDLVSIADRFNLSKGKIRAALAETNGDLLGALDKVLADLRITDETAEAAGKTLEASMNKFGEAFRVAAGKGVAPFREALKNAFDLATRFLEWLTNFNPGVLTLVTGLAGATAAAGGFALALGNVLSIAGKLNDLGLGRGISALKNVLVTPKMIGPLQEGEKRQGGGLTGAGVGLAVGSGVVAGIGITNAIGSATGNEFAAKADFMTLVSTIVKGLAALVTWIGGVLLDLGKSLALAAITVGKVFKLVFDAISAGAQLVSSIFMQAAGRLQQAIGAILEALGGIVYEIGQRTGITQAMTTGSMIQDIGTANKRAGQAQQSAGEKGFTDSIKNLTDIFEHASERIALTDKDKAGIEGVVGDMKKGLADAMTPLFQWADQLDQATKTKPAQAADAAGDIADLPAKTKVANKEQIEAWTKYQADLKELEGEAQADRLKTTQDFETRRADMERQTELRRAREDQDITIRRGREDARLEEQIGDIIEQNAQKQAAERVNIESETTQELAKLGKQRQDDEKETQDKLAEIREQGRLDILGSARKLNAQGVSDAQERLALALQQAMKTKTSETEDTEEQRKAIQQRKADRLKELDAQNNETATRVQKMREDLAARRKEEDDDLALRRQREDEDQKVQIALMEKARDERLNQITTELKAAKTKREEGFVQEFNQLAGANGIKLEITRKYNNADIQELNSYLQRRNATIAAANRTAEAMDAARAAAATAASVVKNPANIIPAISNVLNTSGGISGIVNGAVTGLNNIGANTATQTSGGGLGALSGIIGSVTNAAKGIFGGLFGSYDSGTVGGVPRTGPYKLHQGEIVINPESSALVRAALGSSVTSPQIAGAIAGGGGGVNIGTLSMPMSFGDIGGYKPDQLKQIVGEAMAERLDGLAAKFKPPGGRGRS